MVPNCASTVAFMSETQRKLYLAKLDTHPRENEGAIQCNYLPVIMYIMR